MAAGAADDFLIALVCPLMMFSTMRDIPGPHGAARAGSGPGAGREPPPDTIRVPGQERSRTMEEAQSEQRRPEVSVNSTEL
ncbi:hypothetical protein OG889_13980 [Streptomyces sp. NBC_00481]|uniref:hypothetical protein n=1 Tax=Streptomyces sp. NBC_00481 TaxID=2975755 RepID=UPI002DD892CE|nr:hypothetical protein [Streptomyces sp. NBC_00481]WRY95747.1 hypothetical protein OG889_13980 [Streptomyces sp. NBC_00481]